MKDEKGLTKLEYYKQSEVDSMKTAEQRRKDSVAARVDTLERGVNNKVEEINGLIGGVGRWVRFVEKKPARLSRLGGRSGLNH